MIMTAASTSAPWPASACWKTCAAPEKPVTTVGGRPISRSTARIGVHRIAQRDARRGVEADDHGRQLALVADVQRADGRSMLATAESGTSLPVTERRYSLASPDLVPLVLRQRLQDHR